MKIFVLTFALLASSAFAVQGENVDRDWSTIRPIKYYPQFRDDIPAELRPPARFFENYRTGLGRIVGGSIADPHQFPYQAALFINGASFCGGILISAQTTLTAAHCVDLVIISVEIVLGAHFIQQDEPDQRRIVVNSTHILVHPEWDRLALQNDLALIRFPDPIELTPGVIYPANLPTAADASDLFDGESAVVSGWGRPSDSSGSISDVLRYVSNDVLSNDACRTFFNIVQPSHICLSGENGRGSCNGDSGGPMTVQRDGNSLVIGVVSFGSAFGCEWGFPTVYTRTTYFYDWINSNMI